MRRMAVERALAGLLLLSSCTLTQKQRDEVEDIASTVAEDGLEDSDKLREIERRLDEIERRLKL